ESRYYTKKNGTNKIYMVVFNVPVSGILKIQTPDKVKIIKSYSLLSPGMKYDIRETQKNGYNLNVPRKSYTEPFVIVLETESGNNNNQKYQEAKT
ncbi:MAG TPA: hypothetical protein VNS32_19480, partial [Flavisolibacter sp.]|nr:hypothetical protein [Flavisolibacter sp.]